VEDRTVVARWEGGMRAVVEAGEFAIVVDEPEAAGGTNTGPQPTDLLLASVASCLTLALAHVARRRGVELVGLRVRAVGTYDGPKFVRISVTITSTTAAEVVEALIPQAERICYVSNTLRLGPELRVSLG
jgi:putative redox protein